MAKRKKDRPKKDPQRRLDYYGIFPPPTRNSALAWRCRDCARYHTYTCPHNRFYIVGDIIWKHCQFRCSWLSGVAVDAFRRVLNR